MRSFQTWKVLRHFHVQYLFRPFFSFGSRTTSRLHWADCYRLWFVARPFSVRQESQTTPSHPHWKKNHPLLNKVLLKGIFWLLLTPIRTYIKSHWSYSICIILKEVTYFFVTFFSAFSTYRTLAMLRFGVECRFLPWIRKHPSELDNELPLNQVRSSLEIRSNWTCFD